MQLQPYLERFPAEQILILSQEELQRHREQMMRAAFDFADVDAERCGRLVLPRATRRAAAREGVRTVLCEGGPGLHAELQAARQSLPHFRAVAMVVTQRGP